MGNTTSLVAGLIMRWMSLIEAGERLLVMSALLQSPDVHFSFQDIISSTGMPIWMFM